MAAELDLESALVIGVASSALFDLEESDAVFREQGEERYREYQRDHLDDVLEPGVAFPFIRRLLDLNDLSDRERLVEVVILSRNDPETGMRVMRSVERHGLDITRAIFMQGAPVPLHEAVAHVPLPLRERGRRARGDRHGICGGACHGSCGPR